MILTKQTGFTIIEILLVLVIASFFILLGLQQYQSFTRDKEIQQFRYNLDQIFQSAAYFYKLNCSTGKVLDKALSPADPYVIVNSTLNQLVAQSLIAKWPPIFIPFIDATIGANGYIVQFHQLPASAMNVSGCNMGAAPPCVTTTSQSIQAGQTTVYVWIAEIAVKITDTTKVQLYQTLLGADCTSAISGTGVAPCAANSPGNYLVWERLPSLVSTLTPLWVSMPILQQFNLQYTHDQMYEMNNASYAGTQYYLCGG